MCLIGVGFCGREGLRNRWPTDQVVASSMLPIQGGDSRKLMQLNTIINPQVKLDRYVFLDRDVWIFGCKLIDFFISILSKQSILETQFFAHCFCSLPIPLISLLGVGKLLGILSF